MKRLLIVDDDTIVVNKMVNLLSGFEIDVASNYEEAIDLVRMNDYDLAIIEINLPDYTGTYLAEKIRSIKDTPIAFFSDYNTTCTKEVAREIHARQWSKSDVFKGNTLFGKVASVSGATV